MEALIPIVVVAACCSSFATKVAAFKDGIT
jgi:hypothetical protein